LVKDLSQPELPVLLVPGGPCRRLAAVQPALTKALEPLAGFLCCSRSRVLAGLKTWTMPPSLSDAVKSIVTIARRPKSSPNRHFSCACGAREPPPTIQAAI